MINHGRLLYLLIPGAANGDRKVFSTHIRKQFVVDAGLTFNSPYPVVLRKARGVDLILSFDFSGRPSDDAQPFKVHIRLF